MKSFYLNTSVVLLILLFGCQQQEKSSSGVEKEVVKREVQDQFKKFITALNQTNVAEWSKFYSRNEFLSAFVSTDFSVGRSAFVDTITQYFLMRERQQIEPLAVQIAALSADLALLTSQEKTSMWLKNGENINSRHVFTLIWKNEQDGWKIIHSHESWVDVKAE